MIHQVDGDVMHVPNKETANKFLIVGTRYTDGVRLPGQDILRFRLSEETRVDWLVASLPRIEHAVAEWQNQSTTGVLRLRLRPAANATGAQSAGGEYAVPVKDMDRDITKDKDIVQSRTRPAIEEAKKSPVLDRSREVAEPTPSAPARRGPEPGMF